MNAQNDSSHTPNEDRQLEEMLAPLKRIEPPLEARIASYHAIAAELSSMHTSNQPRDLRWWRRSVSIPVPLAAALALLLAFSLYSSFSNWHGPTVPTAAAPRQEKEPDKVRRNGDVPQPGIVSVSHYETETYLCGVGRLNSESYYAVEE